MSSATPRISQENGTNSHSPIGRKEEGNGDSSSTAARNSHKHQTTHNDPDTEDESHDDGATSPSAIPNPAHRSTTRSNSYTPAEETRVLRKLDRNLTMFLSLLYLLSFLDRSNIGNARIAGLSTSLSLSSSQYSWLLTAFYITYILFEPLILCYRFLPARYYIPACVIAWGLVASCQSVTTSFDQLVVLRGMLGVTEAAFGPGVPFYMTYFYKRKELAYRVGLQISAAPLATSFASLLAWAIVWINQKVGGERVESWRVLFLVEGFPSVFVGIWALWWVPNGPGGARWLTTRERKVAVLRLREEGDRAGSKTTNGEVSLSGSTNPISKSTSKLTTHLATVSATLRNPAAILPALMFFSVNVSFASLPVFLPTIINSMSFSPLTSQALAAPPYLCAFGFVLAIGHYSDKLPDSRSAFLIFSAGICCLSYWAIAIVGLLLGSTTTLSIVLRYMCIYPAACGLFASVVLIITWTLNNQPGSTQKGVAMTVLNLLGQCGPLVGVRLFPDDQGPGFVIGMLVCGGFMAGVVVLSAGLRWWLKRENRRVRDGGVGVGEEVEMEMRERLMVGEDGGGGQKGEGLEASGFGEPLRFRYML